MFTSSQDKGSMEFLESLWNRVIKDMRGDLNKDYTTKEVTVALKQMHLSKAFGPDGMPLLFY